MVSGLRLVLLFAVRLPWLSFLVFFPGCVRGILGDAVGLGHYLPLAFPVGVWVSRGYLARVAPGLGLGCPCGWRDWRFWVSWVFS